MQAERDRLSSPWERPGSSQEATTIFPIGFNLLPEAFSSAFGLPSALGSCSALAPAFPVPLPFSVRLPSQLVQLSRLVYFSVRVPALGDPERGILLVSPSVSPPALRARRSYAIASQALSCTPLSVPKEFMPALVSRGRSLLCPRLGASDAAIVRDAPKHAASVAVVLCWLCRKKLQFSAAHRAGLLHSPGRALREARSGTRVAACISCCCFASC